MKLITHNGAFHYDEVLASVMLLMIYPDAQITRTRDETIIDTGDIVYDVGRVFDPSKNRFDHHQNTFNSTWSSKYDVKLSSSGLIFKYYGEQLLALYNFTKESTIYNFIVEKIYQEFFLPEDAIDNGVDVIGKIKVRSMADVVSNFNVYTDKNEPQEAQDKRFFAAMEFVKQDLLNYLNYVLNDYAANYFICYNELKNFSGDILYTEEGYSRGLLYDVNEELKKDLKFVIAKWKEEYHIMTFQESKNSFKIRYPLHPEWRGLAKEQLDAVSQIQNCIFVHASGFTGANKTKEGAFEMCKKSLEYIRNQH